MYVVIIIRFIGIIILISPLIQKFTNSCCFLDMFYRDMCVQVTGLSSGHETKKVHFILMFKVKCLYIRLELYKI